LLFCLFILPGAYAEEGREELPVLTEGHLRLNAYTQVRYTHWEERHDGFRLRRARFGLRGQVIENFDYSFQVETAQSPYLLDARIGIKFPPHTELTLGQFKVPFSLENLTPSSGLDTINRSQTVEKLCPGRDIGAKGRDIGVILRGHIDRIEYTVGIFNGSGINRTDENDQKDIALRLVLYPVRSFGMGFSHYDGKYSPYSDAPVIDRDRTGVDIHFVQGPLSIKGEYLFARDGETEKYGWYVQGCYSLIPEKIQAIVKYDSLERNKNISGDRLKVVTLGLNWFFSEKTKLQFNYEYHKREAERNSDNVFLAQLQAGF
jgi:phosphate-selective porin OprO/OprP